MDIEPGSSHIGVCVHNMSAQMADAQAHTVMGWVQVAYKVPNMLASEPEKVPDQKTENIILSLTS